MSDDLLPYYNHELADLKHLGAEFAQAHKKVAGRLRLSQDAIEDPHVSRLVEAVAFLNARVRKKLDDDFPELTDALLSVLYPHFLAPVPSMAVAQFECDRELTAGYVVPRGTLLETERVEGEPVRYQTCSDTTTWPLRVEAARLSGAPLRAPTTPRSSSAAAVLQLSLKTLTEGVSLRDLRPASLRFFLRGQEQHAFGLHELLLGSVVEIAVASSARDPQPHVLGASALRQVGLEPDEGVLPFPLRSFPGYRLLTEYFAFPARFLFVELTGLPPAKLQKLERSLEVFFYLDRAVPELEPVVKAEHFALGCTPVVNLFPRRAEPMRLAHTESEYRVIPDARRPRALEVYSIDRVSASSAAGETRAYRPFYGLDHGGESEGRAWWHAARRPVARAEDQGTEVHLSLVDLEHRPSISAGWVLEVHTTCLNRDLPSRLPIAPPLRFSEGGGPIRSIRCLTNPTRTLRRATGGGALWRLISHLSLNHLSLSGKEAGADALREILRLYDVAGSSENREIIDGILAVRSRETTMRVVSGGHPGFARGTEVTLQLDEGRFTGTSTFLFGSVLERFLALYGTVNTFVELVLTSNKQQEELQRWKPRAGAHPLL